MWLDFLALFLVIFFAAAGYFRGVLAVGLTFLALGAAYWGAPGVAGWIGGGSGWDALDPESRYWVLLGAAALLLYLAVNFAGLWGVHFFTRHASEEGEEAGSESRHQALGLFLGAAQGLLAGVLVSFLIGAAPGALRRGSPWLDRQAGGSRLVALTGRYNPLLRRQAELDLLDRLRAVAQVLGLAQGLGAAEVARLPERVREFLEDSRLKAFFEDSRLARALRETDYGEILSRDRWRKLFDDAELREALRGVDIEGIRTEIERALSEHRGRLEEGAP